MTPKGGAHEIPSKIEVDLQRGSDRKLNIREGLARARKAGIQLGRPHSVNPHRDDVVALREQGLSGRKIAKALGIPSPTVFKLLRCPRDSRAF